MIFKHLERFLWVLGMFVTFNGFSAPTNEANDEPSLLELTDRGSISNTPRILSPYNVMVEAGFQYQRLTSFGTQHNFPQPFIFVGLPGHNEVVLALPNYIQQTNYPTSGLEPVLLGVKHEMKSIGKLGLGAEVLLTPPSGSASFGSQGLGAAVNGLFSYDFNPKLSLAGMFGVSTATDAIIDGGGRFNSVNPSVVLLYRPSNKMSVFAEIFGQSKTTFEQTGNCNVDFGLLYLITPNVLFDVEVGQQLTNQVGFFKTFINSGFTLKFES